MIWRILPREPEFSRSLNIILWLVTIQTSFIIVPLLGMALFRQVHKHLRPYQRGPGWKESRWNSGDSGYQFSTLKSSRYGIQTVASIHKECISPKTQVISNFSQKVVWDWWISHRDSHLHVYHLSYLHVRPTSEKSFARQILIHQSMRKRRCRWVVILSWQNNCSFLGEPQRRQRHEWRLCPDPFHAVAKEPQKFQNHWVLQTFFIFFAPNKFDLMTRNEFFPRTFTNLETYITSHIFILWIFT